MYTQGCLSREVHEFIDKFVEIGELPSLALDSGIPAGMTDSEALFESRRHLRIKLRAPLGRYAREAPASRSRMRIETQERLEIGSQTGVWEPA